MDEKSKKLAVGIDCDGVLYDFVGAACEWSGFKRENATDWDLFKAWGAPNLWKIFDKHVQQEFFCLMSIPVLATAKSFVWTLDKYYETVIVTSPYRDAPFWPLERERALLRDFGIPRERIVSTRAKQYARVDVLIDDQPANIERFPGVGILFDQPWNRNCVAGIRCKGYQEVLDTLNDIARRQ